MIIFEGKNDAPTSGKTYRLNADAENLIKHSLLDTAEFRQRLRRFPPAQQIKIARADVADYREIKSVPVVSVDVPDGRRQIREDAVAFLMESMKAQGLRTPITLRYYPARPDFLNNSTAIDALVLWAGRHRLEAARRLGWDEIEAIVYQFGDETEARLWEIAENLHRAELTALERDEQVAEWIRLSDGRVSRQVDAKPQGGRPAGGTRAAARDLGLAEPDARRAVKVAGLSEQAKAVARDAGLDDNRSALLEASRHEASEDQIAALKARQAKKEADAAFQAESRAKLPQAIKDREQSHAERHERSKVGRTQSEIAEVLDTFTGDDRIAELEDANHSLESEVAELKAENKCFGEMKVQFDQGGFEKVVAGKDEEIRVLKTRVYRESQDKASWARAAKWWKEQAIKQGWTKDIVIPFDEPKDEAFADV